ncbi:MAG: extracellular solute-binding protein [Chromatiales bacterium]|nr:extracellular solute-binding protein [Chromatiales bacterium]
MKSFIRSLLFVAAATTAMPAVSADNGEIVVYSARKEHLIKPLFDAYTKKTGVEVKYVTDKAGPLLARLKAEGANTPADMLITVDAGNLWHAAERGVLAEVNSAALQSNVPAHLRDPNNRWFGLSVRARTVVYSTERVKPEELTSYEDLADPKWKGRLCLRTSKKVYNQSLVAMMMERLGKEKAEEVVKGWVANLAVPPFSNDTKTMKAVAAGQCDVAVVNTYYFGRLQKKEPDVKLALFWPNQNDRGVHVNVSGAGITKHAKNAKAATDLLVWLSSDEAQQMFAGLNMEYPANGSVKADPMVAAWGSFKGDEGNIAKAGELQAEAVMLMDRAGYR